MNQRPKIVIEKCSGNVLEFHCTKFVGTLYVGSSIVEMLPAASVKCM